MSGTLSSIYNNISLALYLHSKDMARLQEQVSTGSRINRASDGPSAAYQILGLDSQGRSLQNYIDNLLETIGGLDISSTIIEDIVPAFADVKTRLSQVTSGIHDEAGRQRAADGIDDILEQVASLVNTKHMDQYLFGGSDTASAPYLIERTDGKITRVTYQGSFESRDIEVAPGVEASAFYVGDDLFHLNERGAPVFLGDTGAKAGTGTSSVQGDVWLTVTGSVGNYTLSIDDGLSTFNADGTDDNLAVTHSQTGEILYVNTKEIDSTGVELVRVPGTHDIFNILITIRDILENDKELSEAQLEELRNDSIDLLDEVSNLLVQSSVAVGAKVGYLEDLRDSLQNMKYNAEGEATRLQEADIAQLAIDLSRREILYQMSLSIAAKLMSTSLLDYIV